MNNNKLVKLQEKRALVSIKRKNINNMSIQGFILGFSKKLILIQYVYDFNIDGFMVLKRSDITNIKSNKTDIFQTRLLKNEGLYSKVNFSKQYNVKNWLTVFSEIATLYNFVSIENESPSYFNFILGKVKKIGKNKIFIHEFSGTVQWKDSLSKMRYKDISSFQVGNNYANVYDHYFNRNP